MIMTTLRLASAASLVVLLGGFGLAPVTAGAADAETIEFGKKSAFDRKRGNCLACHMMDDGESPGNIGPPLVAMKGRFPDRDKLRLQIYDPTIANADTRMPPFGKHGVISEKEIDAIVDYLLTL